ncbi:MAG: hypothetical protein GY701_24210 [Sulfitobacter sp.]|nr:hypothetical protein [Sulfitobacter sp.]
MGDVVEQAKEALYGGDAEEGRSHLYPLINEIYRLEADAWLARRALADLKAEVERSEEEVKILKGELRYAQSATQPLGRPDR